MSESRSEKYFFINSNICFPGEELNFDKFIYNISGNTGNSYITYSIIKTLYGNFQKVDDIKNLWLYQPNQRDIDRINNEYSKVILVLQDNLRIFDSYLKHDIYEGLTDFFRKIKIPIVVFSLGSNSFDKNWQILQDGLNKNLVNLLKVISDNTVSFGIRGEYTADVLNKLGIKNVEIVGCPTYFENGRSRVIHKPELTTDFKVLSGGYFKNINSDKIHYVLQDESLFVKAIAFENERLLETDLQSVKIDDYFKNFLLKAYLENRMSVFSDMEKWKEFDKSFDFYVGTRVHGAIMAINAGLPAIVTSGDGRSEEMCNLFGITRRLHISENYDLKQLYEEIDVDVVNRRYVSLYENYVNWLGNNGLKVVTNCDEEVKEKVDQNSSVGNCAGIYEINSKVEEFCVKSYQILLEKSKEDFLIVKNLKKNNNLSGKERKISKYLARFLSFFVIGSQNRKKVRTIILDRLNKS